jgi:hypothetical protein
VYLGTETPFFALVSYPTKKSLQASQALGLFYSFAPSFVLPPRSSPGSKEHKKKKDVMRDNILLVGRNGCRILTA